MYTHLNRHSLQLLNSLTYSQTTWVRLLRQDYPKDHLKSLIVIFCKLLLSWATCCKSQYSFYVKLRDSQGYQQGHFPSKKYNLTTFISCFPNICLILCNSFRAKVNAKLVFCFNSLGSVSLHTNKCFSITRLLLSSHYKLTLKGRHINFNSPAFTRKFGPKNNLPQWKVQPWTNHWEILNWRLKTWSVTLKLIKRLTNSFWSPLIFKS